MVITVKCGGADYLKDNPQHQIQCKTMNSYGLDLIIQEEAFKWIKCQGLASQSVSFS